LEPISIVLIASVELKLLAPLISISWRIYFDNKLSNILEKSLNTLNVLKQYNSKVILKTKLFWICIAGFLAHFMLYILSVIGFLHMSDYPVFAWVSHFFLVCNE